MVNDIAVQDFVNAIKETPTDTNTTYQATVSRIDDEGVVWVNIHGSQKETPTASTSAEVKRGDVVTVQWRNNKLYIGGNYSNPSAGVVRVASVEQDAARAFLAAENAEYDAARAHEAADRAESEAVRAYNEAERATGYANDALTQLGVVEEVVDVLSWISEHGTYKKSTDTEVVEHKMYFTLTGTVVVPETYDDGTKKITNLESYYEKVNNVYVKTSDTTYSSSKTYYTVSAELVANPTGSPSANNYYEIFSIDKAVQNYISSHLALTDSGLWVVKDNQGYKVLLANDGLRIYDSGGHLVSTFGENITFDAERPQRIGNDTTYVKFYDSNNDHVADKIEIKGDVTIDSSVTIGGKPQSEYLNSNIEVGGRNLLQHTDDYADWTLSGVTQTDSTPTDILNYTQISSDANAVAVCTYRFPYSYIRNKTITFSCFAKAAANTNMEMFWEIDLHADTTSSRLKYTTPSMDFTATGNWQKVSRTVDVKDSIFTLGTGSPNYETCYARILLHRLPACHYAVQVKELMCEVGNVASDWSLATEDLQNSISAAQSTADNAAPKTSAVYRSQRIYYRKTSSGAPNKNETWLSTSGTGYGNWSLSIPQLTSGTTKYPYLYTAVQTQTVAQQAAGNTCSCSTVLLDDTTTVIDGGTIITGTVNANAVNASSGTFNEANIPNLNASKINAGTIAVGVLPDDALNSNIQIGGRNLLADPYTRKSSVTNNGLTLSYDPADGTFKISGTNTKTDANWSFNTIYALNSVGCALLAKNLKKDTQYTMTLYGMPIGLYLQINGYNSSGNAIALCTLLGNGSTARMTFTLPSATDLSRGIQTAFFGTRSTARALSGSFRIKLEEGNKGSDWTRGEDSGLNTSDLNSITNENLAYGTPLSSASGINTGNTGYYILPNVNKMLANLTAGDDITLSFDAKADAAVTDTTVYAYQNSGRSIEGNFIINLTTGWQRFVIHTKVVDYAGTYNSGSIMFLYKSGDTTKKYIRKLQIERGLNVTAWNEPPASNYVTYIDSTNGVRVHNADDTTNYVQLDSNGTHIYKGGSERAVFGDTVRLKSASGFPQVCVDSNEAWFAYSANDWATLNSNGFNIVKDSTSVAFYGDTARVGKASDTNIVITPASTDSGIKMNVKNSAGTSSVRIADIGFDNSQGYETSKNFPKGAWFTFGDRAGTAAQRGYYSLVSGFNNIASHNASAAFGINNKVYSPSAISAGMENVIGDSTKTSQNSYTTNTAGNCCATFGYGLIASGQNQLICGAYNVSSASNAFMVGIGTSSARKNAFVVTTGGDATLSGRLTQGSDRRLKEHISYLDDDAVEFINKLKPAFYKKDGGNHVGFYAQDVEEADKWNCMTGEMNGFMTLGYTELIAPLVAYVQKLEKRIEELERSK